LLSLSRYHVVLAVKGCTALQARLADAFGAVDDP
jgi:hypothetical protein